MQTDHGHEEEVEVRKERLSESKRRLLEQRIRGIGSATEEDRVLPRAPGASVPLSAEQRRVWLHASQQPEVPIYNEPFTIHKRGSLDVATLEAAFDEVLRRHEAWRTSFSAEGEQIVHPSVRIVLPLIDLSELPEAEREAEALRIATEDARNPIPLDIVPLFRTRLVRMKEDEHRLYLTFHHIIFDGVSISRIFVPELTAAYEAIEQRKPIPLTPPQLHYGDYAIWRERHVESPAVKQHLAWWTEQLAGELPILALPEDRPRPAAASHHGSMECFDIPPELLQNLRKLSRERGATLYMSLLAAYKALLFRYSGQNDLIVGSATDARRRPELEGVMGYFLDTFVVRTRPLAETSFSEYLSQTREMVLGGLAAADVPFDRVVREVNPRRDPSQHPIFQAFFSIRPPMPSPAPGWDLSQTDVTVGTTKFDLYLELGEWPDRMEARFFYNTEIWNDDTIRRMAGHWRVLLESICRNPDEKLGNLAILTPEEKDAVLAQGGWNDTVRAFPQTTLSSLIEEQVHRTPRAIAASFGNERWTYQQLNSRAGLFAAELQSAGVKPGSIVAVGLERSLDLLAGLIAVLKTGAAYLPLDVQMPRERILLCLADAKASAILTQRSLAQHVISEGIPVVLADGNSPNRDLKAIGAAVAPVSAGTGLLANDPEDTAYVIYTSGTTGEPKGVEISHRNLVNLLASMQAAPGFGAKDVCLAVTPISFDIAALELFLPLICGGKVVIASRAEAQDPLLLAKAIDHSNCTVIQATPATWRALLLSGWRDAASRPQGTWPALRILCGGESLPRELADRLLATGAEVWNMYGPTETTIWSTIHRVSRASGTDRPSVSVGLPIANTTTFILDAQLQLLPVGIPGELFLGGTGLAKGYLGQPRKTGERFLTIESAGGARLYRTGDLAVRRSDGTIEILGRTDHQVKVRGYRIELEAVEAAVLRHPLVAAAAARVWPEASGDLRLSVYVVGKDGPAPNLSEMRTFLRRSLPEGMIPSDVIALDAIPLTPHGKVDRARLPELSAREPQPVAQTALSSSVEVRLAAIWGELLGRKNVGPTDNFFEMGGHSVLVVALQHRLATEFGQTISVAELFQNPTVRQQARLTQRINQTDTTLPSGVINMQPKGTHKSIFWLHYLKGDLAEAIGDEQPFFSVVLTWADFAALGETASLQSIAACLVNKILATQPEGPRIIGGHCAWGILAYEVACQLRAAGHEISLLVLFDARNPSYVEPQERLTQKLTYLPYCVKRAARLGLRTSWVHFRERAIKPPKASRTEMKVAQDLVEAAALSFKPKKYDGRVLLLLASDRPPHQNLVPGWQSVISRNLYTHYLSGHHRELTNPENLRSAGVVIAAHLVAANEDMPTNDQTSSPSFSMSMRDAMTSSGTPAAVTGSGSSA
jgi:amino acid adenylation domain-containing protein